MPSGSASRESWQKHAWLLPVALGAVAIGYLSWGAWVSAHDPHWLYINQAWWRVLLRPQHDWTLLCAIAFWLGGLACFWWPRRSQDNLIGLITVVAMARVGAVLGMASLWRQPTERLRARFVRDVTVVTGLDGLAIQLLRQLAQAGNPRNIIVIEPNEGHPLLQEVRQTGARVITGSPASERIIGPIISGWRGCTLSHLYALGCDVRENEDILAASARILGQFRPDPERQPHLVARIDDPRHADSWRGAHAGRPSTWFEDALSPAELTARTLVGRILRSTVRQVVLCGDSTLTITVLLELARRAWEQAELVKAAVAGRAVSLAAIPPDGSQPDSGRSPDPAPFPVKRLILMDPEAADILREYMASASLAALDCAPEIVSRPVGWRGHLIATLDALAPDDARDTAAIIIDRSSETMHEAGRVARLHPNTPVFVQVAASEGTDEAVFDLLHPFRQGLLVDGNVPEDAWTRVARHWHECFRLRHPVALGDPKMYERHPWDELDQFIRQDNILRLRSILSAVAARGRQWVPARAVPPGSFIEITDGDLEEVARAEHTRWYRRRLAAGWSAGDGQGAAAAVEGPPHSNASIVPWPQLPPDQQAGLRESIRSQLAQLEAVGYMAIVPSGGPPGAARFQRVGIVLARKLEAPRSWTRRSNEEELRGDAGDWRVIDNFGDVRSVGNAEFRESYEPLDGNRWRRVGIYSAWRASETLVIRTKEGRATANPGDWVVEGIFGERWPVDDEQFKRSYRPADNAEA